MVFFVLWVVLLMVMYVMCMLFGNVLMWLNIGVLMCVVNVVVCVLFWLRMLVM